MPLSATLPLGAFCVYVERVLPVYTVGKVVVGAHVDTHKQMLCARTRTQLNLSE